MAITWKSAVSGNWSVNGNWNPAGPPTGDDVTIAIGGASYTSTIDQSFSVTSLVVNSISATVVEAAGASLTIAGGAIEVLAGVLNLTQANTISSFVLAYGGELDIGAAGALGMATLSIQNGLVRGTSNVSISNPIQTNLTGSTQTIAAAHGTTLTLASSTASYTGGNSLLKFGVAGSDGTVNVAGANSWTVTNTDKIEVVAGTLTGNITGLGSLTKAVASTTIDAGATLDVNSAGISIASLIGGGTLTNSGGATACSVNGGNFSGVISGWLSLVMNGNVTLSGANTYLGLTEFNAGVTTISNGSALSSGLLLFAGGTLIAGGNMTLGNNGTIYGVTTATIAAATGDSLSLTGTISFSTGSAQKLVFGAAGALGAVTFGSGGGIAGFGAGDIIDFTNVAYAAGEKMVITGNANGIESLALESVSNTVLATINLVGYYSPYFLNVGDDGGGHAQISLLSSTFAPPPPTATQSFFGLPWSDVLLQNGASASVWFNEFSTVVSTYALTGLPAGASIVGAGDFNADGLADVLLMNGGVLSDGDLNTGVFTALSTLGSAGGFTVGGVGDFNGDGTSDILLQSNGVFVDYTVKNGAVTGGSLVGSAAGWTVGGVGDFNGDGTSDILLQNNGSFTIWDMKNGALTQGYSLTPLPGWSVVGTGDFNGDGTTDILLQSGGTLVDYIIHNNAVAWGNLLSTSLAGWTVVGTGDYDGDGTSDILLQAGSTVVDYTMHGGLVQSGAVFGSTGGLQVVGK